MLQDMWHKHSYEYFHEDAQKTYIQKTFVQEKGNVGSGNDIEKTATHSRPQTHNTYIYSFATSVKLRENEFEK